MDVPLKRAALGLAGVVVGMHPVYALAHHSFARFDADRQVKLQGTVHEFQWTNPHAPGHLGRRPERTRAAMGHRDEWSQWLGASALAAEDFPDGNLMDSATTPGQ
jgi:hypothetical protein